MNGIWNFFRELKMNGKRNLDDLSFFLLATALFLAIVMTILRLNRFLFFTWLLVFIAYWRVLSNNRAKRARENQQFIKHFYPIKSKAINFSRRLTRKETYLHFPCKSCSQPLRIPKKTHHIKVTCPKCSHSFVKKTIRGYLKGFRRNG